MPPVFASIDLETTGLDAQRDAIIEVGIVIFQGDQILTEWSSLVNPRRRIPPGITALTGITQEEVNEARTLLQVRPQIEHLTDGLTLVAHNAPFDLAFLQQNNLCQTSPALDTLELATILCPRAAHYGLGALQHSLSLPPHPELPAHRALADAYTTALLYQYLQQKGAELPFDTLEEIVRAGRSIAWPSTPFFEEALAVAGRNAFAGAPPRRRRDQRPLFRAPRESFRALRPADPPQPIDAAEIAALLDEGGRLGAHFQGFEHRPQQVEMTYAIAQALNQGRHLMVEAGTGTGKSLAYLLPAIHWAVQNDEQVVISTNTINLQDQLISKDIPDLHTSLPFDFRATILKGRSNYVCPRMVNALRRSGPADSDEMRLLAKLLVWLPQTETGERDEISLRSMGEQIAWSRLNADNEGCTAESCASFATGCPLHVARQAAETAHIIVVNHALLLSDIVTGNRVLPAYRYLIVDEAHHLENATTNGLSFEADQRLVERLLGELTYSRRPGHGGPRTLSRHLAARFLGPIERQIMLLQEGAAAAGREADAFFWDMLSFLQEHSGDGQRQYSAQVLITSGLRIQPSWENVEISWEAMSQRFHLIAEGLRRILIAMDEVTETFDLPDGEDLTMRAKNLQRSVAEVRQRLDELVFEHSDDTIYWAELPAKGERVSLHAAPLEVGPLVEEHLFHKKTNVILTSATLQTSSPSSEGRSGFDYIRERLNAWEADELAVGSPFDFESKTLLFLPTDMPEPRQPGYQRLIDSSLVALARAMNGRMLVLFTSYAQLAQTADAIRGALSDANIALLQQGMGTSRQQLVESFRSAPELGRAAVLLGTRSFWEGVDIPGPALSCVVIVKLPFDVPSDPIFAARRQSFENPFYDYAVPEAVLRFRQGFGRLIRSKSDYGVVVCLDKRLLTKAYGRFFLESLPRSTVQRDKITLLPQAAAGWIGRHQSASAGKEQADQ